MKGKVVYGMMLILLLTSMLALAFNIQPVKAEPTTVSGDITTDTTWYFSESPYIVTGDVTLFPGYTLTIEPGVTVLFYPNTRLIIRGTLNAGGTESHRITFTCPNGRWYGISIATELGGKATIRFANFYNASTAVYISLSNPGYPVVEIYDSVFANNSIGLGGYVGSGGTLVERCTFENNTYGITQADYNVYNSVFKKNSYGLYATERVNVYYSTFVENQVALYGGRGEVKYCQITNNGIGVQSFFEGFTLSNNIIANNDVGVILGQYDTYSAPVEYNDIYNNVAYNLKNTGDANKLAMYNWWGTTDPYEIEIKIYDGYDDASVGVVEYSPVLTGPHDTAPSAIEVERAITTGPGGIFKDTTWTLSESPYVITEDLTLFPGYTLTIQPGVEVKFSSDTKLTIRGSLVAEGIESNQIVFTSTEPGTKGDWDGIDVATHLDAKASIRFADFSYAHSAIYVHLGGSGPVNIYDSVFTDNVIALGGYGGYWEMIVERCIFERNTYAVTSADKRISNSIFRNNDYGLYATERISVYSSMFTENQIALYGGRGEVKNCEISNNNIGVQSFFEGFTLSQNTIKYNDVGVVLGQYDTYSPPVYLNNFINNAIQVQNPANTVFHSPEKITYTYNLQTYTSYLGNYWNDYTGSDADGDGIGDTPYAIDSNKDDYPLMETFENYLAPTPPPPSPVYGKGIWITYIWEIESGDLSKIIERLKSTKVRWVAIKCGDSNSYWLSEGRKLFEWAKNYGGFSEVIKRFHDKGIRVLGAHFIYGRDVHSLLETETDVSNWILGIDGIDGLLIDVEPDMDPQWAPDKWGDYAQKLEDYLKNIRNAHPNSFITYTSYARSQGWKGELHRLFTQYCDVSMPQAYWAARPQKPEEEIVEMEENLGVLYDKWHKKPIMPMGQGGKLEIGRDVYPGEIKEFCDLLFEKGYLGVSLFRYEIISNPGWGEYSGCFNSDITFTAYSPVDLVVTDPDGLSISKAVNEIAGASYMEFDVDGDGDPDDVVTILHRKLGNYSIEVIPEPEATPTDTFTLVVSTKTETVVSAENVTISGIPSKPYIFESTDEIPPETQLNIGEPKSVGENVTYVTSATLIALVAEDDPGGSGVASIAYRIYNTTYDSSWRTYTEPFHLIELSDGTYQIDYNSTDNAGNIEPTNTVTVILDNTPPTTLLTIGEPQCIFDGDIYINSASPFTLDATDNMGSGVALTVYKIYNSTYDSGWITYTGNFSLPTWLDNGPYLTAYNSTDNLGNVEAENILVVILRNPLVDTWMTDSDFNEIESFRAVFTPYGDTELYKLTATNPGQFYLNIQVNNTWPEPLNITIVYLIDANFTFKGAKPIHVYADLERTIDITANCTFSDNTITVYNVAPNTIIYVTVHLDYALKGTTWTAEEVEAWYSEHSFSATVHPISSEVVITDPELHIPPIPLGLIFLMGVLPAIILCLGILIALLRYVILPTKRRK